MKCPKCRKKLKLVRTSKIENKITRIWYHGIRGNCDIVEVIETIKEKK